MQRFLTTAILALPAISMAGEEPDSKDDAWKKIFNLLPPPSELKEVMVPRYDDETKLLSSVLKAQVMTLIDENQIVAKTVAVEFFKPDKSTQGRIDLETATIDKARSLLTTREPVEIHFDDLDATGTGLYLLLETGEGVLLGPATTTIHHRPETVMNHSQSPFRAMAVVGMSLFTQSLLAAPPTPMTAAELAAIQADAVSREPIARERIANAGTELEKNVADGAAASKAAAAFLAKVDLPPVKSDDPSAAAAKPLELPADPESTKITCDGPVYFDPDEGVFVYLNNVVVDDPQFTFTGANEVKAFFGKKPAKPKKEKGDKPAADSKKDAGATTEGKPSKSDKKAADKSIGGNLGANFDKVERIIATGKIKIVQKPDDGEQPIEASGAIFTYNAKTGMATISGGYPWVRQGGQYFRATKAENMIRIYPKESRFDTMGKGWDNRLILPRDESKN